MIRKEMKRFMAMILTGALFFGSLPFSSVMVQANTSETALPEKSERKSESEYTEDLKFLTYCDMDALTAWDNSIATMTPAEADEIKDFIETNILSGNETDYEKAQLIYEWIIENVSYAYDMDGWLSADPYYVFQTGRAVCGGYSNLYKAMLSLVDVPAVVITGDTTVGGHAWNAVYADDRWFYADSTWGASYGYGFFDEGIAHFSTEHTTTRLEAVSIETEDGLVIGYDQGIAVIGTNFETTTVNIPETFKEFDITSVSYKLFNRIYGVTTLHLSKNIKAIDTQVSAPTLESITVDADNQTYASREGVLFTKDFSEVLIYPDNKQSESFTLPKETEKFDVKETFDNPYLVNISAEEGNALYSSFDGALYNHNQTELLFVPMGKTEIRIPSNASINDLAFANVDTGKVTIYAEKNSPAHQYAQTNHINFVHTADCTCEEQIETVIKATTTSNGQIIISCKDCGEILETKTVFAVDTMTLSEKTYKYDGENKMPKVVVTDTKGNVLAEDSYTVNYPAECKEAGTYTVTVILQGNYSGTLTATYEIVKPVKPAKPANPFKDVKEDAFYYDEVLWAVEEGITKGVEPALFKPENGCTRAEIVTFLWRAADQPEIKAAECTFKDVNKDHYYYNAMMWAISEDITTGYNADMFGPNDTCTRAQMVTFLWREAGRPEAEKTDVTFKDVNENDYYYPAMLWAVEQGITTGKNAETFAPNDTVTRGETVTFLYRASR